MLYSVHRLCEQRTAVVLVEKRQLSQPAASNLLRRLQNALSLPVMLVARDDDTWTGARAAADFNPHPHLYALMDVRDIDWSPLPSNCHFSEVAGYV